MSDRRRPTDHDGGDPDDEPGTREFDPAEIDIDEFDDDPEPSGRAFGPMDHESGDGPDDHAAHDNDDHADDGDDLDESPDEDSDEDAGRRRRFARGERAGRGKGGRRRWGRGRARPAISGMRVLVGTIVTIVVVVALFLVAYFTPLMSVRSVEVTGNSVLQAEEITSAAAIPAGEPLLQVDAAAAAQRVSLIPRVASARVKREYPSTISIVVVERVPVMFTERDGQKYLMDKLGFEFAQQDPPPGLAQLRTPNPGSGDLSTRAALTVMTEVPPYVSEQIAAIEVSSPVNIVLVLKDNRTVVWGDDSRNAEKAETLRHVLTQEGTEYNVSSPSNPTFK